MLASDILSRAATILQDEDHVRWPLPELVGWLNDGMKAIVLAQPSAHAVSYALPLSEGTLQALSNASHLRLLRITRNLASTSSPRVGGRVVRVVQRDLLDMQSPNWHDPSDTPYKKEVRQYVFDEQNPREFYVWPGNDGTGVVEAVLSTLPTAISAAGDVDTIGSYATAIDLPEPWGVVLLDFILYRAYSKDALEGGAGRAGLHYQQFAGAVGIKVQGDSDASPNARQRVTRT